MKHRHRWRACNARQNHSPTGVRGRTFEALETRQMLDVGGLDALNQSFSYRLYEDLLFRLPDSSGATFWQSRLAAGDSRTAVAQGTVSSPEYQTHLIQGAYGALLGRQATAEEVDAGRALLAQGDSAEQFEASLLGSAEYFQTRGGGTNAGFLQALYQDILDRPIESAGATYWGNVLSQSTLPDARQTVTYQLLTSPENQQAFLRLSYQRLLHRDADPAGIAAWMSAMRRGLTEQQAIVGIVGSREYFNDATPVTGQTTVSGKLESASGQPLAGVPVSLGGANATSSSDGSFTLTLNPYSAATENMSIPVPAGDPFFDPQSTGTQTIPMRRDQFDPNTGTSVDNPRQFPNEVTTFLDSSQIYGSDPTRADELRTFSGGQLKTSPGDLLPLNNTTYFPGGPLANDNNGPNSPDTLFAAGDVRANENEGLVSLQTLFLREHNYWAQQYQAQHPDWTDEQLYQAARKMVIAEMDHITYSEYLPLLLGPNAIQPYQGYQATVNPSINTLFSTAAFRFAHSQTFNAFAMPLPGGGSLPNQPLTNATFNSQPVISDGIDPFLLGMATQSVPGVTATALDVDRNELFGPPGSGGIDLVSVDIERGRDLGLPTYNQARQLYGLPVVTSFAQITSDPTLQASLQKAYGSVNDIDVLVGGLAEDHAAGAMVGPLFQKIIADQFERLRDGDRFWYENGQFTAAELAQINQTTLADIIDRDTGITTLSGNVFTNASSVPAGPGPGPGTIAAASDPSEVRTLNGTGNNLGDPNEGSAGTDLAVVGGKSYFADGVASPGGVGLPGPRTISNDIFARPPSSDPADPTALDVIWGQFITHDMDLTHDEYPDTLKAYGETLNGPTSYGLTAESLSMLLGHNVYQGTENTINQPVVVQAK